MRRAFSWAALFAVRAGGGGLSAWAPAPKYTWRGITRAPIPVRAGRRPPHRSKRTRINRALVSSGDYHSTRTAAGAASHRAAGAEAAKPPEAPQISPHFRRRIRRARSPTRRRSQTAGKIWIPSRAPNELDAAGPRGQNSQLHGAGARCDYCGRLAGCKNLAEKARVLSEELVRSF